MNVLCTVLLAAFLEVIIEVASSLIGVWLFLGIGWFVVNKIIVPMREKIDKPRPQNGKEDIMELIEQKKISEKQAIEHLESLKDSNPTAYSLYQEVLQAHNSQKTSALMERVNSKKSTVDNLIRLYNKGEHSNNYEELVEEAKNIHVSNGGSLDESGFIEYDDTIISPLKEVILNRNDISLANKVSQYGNLLVINSIVTKAGYKLYEQGKKVR